MNTTLIKYTRLIFLVVLTGYNCIAYSQVINNAGGGDSSVIPRSRMQQHTGFLNNSYAFPAKPRNQWEVGLSGGIFSIAGDVRSRFPGYGASLQVRKALGYVFSLRGELGYGTTRGLNFQPSRNYRKNSAWVANYPLGAPVFYNYKSEIFDLSLQGVFALNNIRFHRTGTGFSLYGFAGIGGMIYDTRVDALDGSGNPYTTGFQNIYNKYAGSGFSYSNRKDIKKDLKNLLDDDYETTAQRDPGQPELFDKPFRPAFSIGAGMQFRLSRLLSIAVEDKITVVKSDLLDGQQWQENDATTTAQTRDYDNYNFLSLGVRVALGGKRSVEPLWWINPLDYAYNELNQPTHLKLPHPHLGDADGDGVADQFDQEPNTPAGAPVNAHGMSLDTDGDGVPDFRDKELITPTQCQPVDAEGVGKCPPPACCNELRNVQHPRPGMGHLPTLHFSNGSSLLGPDSRMIIAKVAEKMRNDPGYKVAVIGYAKSSKASQQLSWERVNSAIEYFIEKEGISSERFVFRYGAGNGSTNSVDLKDASGEEGTGIIAAPFPHLRKQDRP